MIPISSAASGGLIWSKISSPRGYVLKLHGEVIGSLRRTSLWSSEFQADSSNGKWRFHRAGCFQTQTEIIDVPSSVQIATYKTNWSGAGALAFSDGQTFWINSKGYWRPVWKVLSDDGQPVLLIRPREKTVDLAKNLNLPDDRLTLLTIFTWYVQQQVSEEAASSVAAVVAATG
jgi:hypothetical protein